MAMAPCCAESSAPVPPRRALLLLPRRRPPFEGAVLAAIVAAPALLQRARPCLTQTFKSKRCKELPLGAACLVLYSDAEVGTERRLSRIPDILKEAEQLLGPGGSEEAETEALHLSQHLRSCGDHPGRLGPGVGRLSAWLKEGASQGRRFLGGDRLSLRSDVALVGALLTSRSWCRRLAGASLQKLQAAKQPLKGTDLVLQWMLTVLSEEPCQQALRAARDLEPSWPSLHDEVLPPDLCDFLRSLEVPEPLCAQELLSAREREELEEDRSRAEFRRGFRSWQEQRQAELAPQGESERFVSPPLIDRGSPQAPRIGSVDAKFRTKHHEVRLERLGLCPALRGSARDLNLRLFPDRDPAVEAKGIEILRLLVEYRGSLEALDSDGGTPAFYAAMAGNVQCFEYMLQAGGEKVFHHQDYLDRYPLYWATSNDQPAVVWRLWQLHSFANFGSLHLHVELLSQCACIMSCDIIRNLSLRIRTRAAAKDARSRHGRTALAKAFSSMALTLRDLRSVPVQAAWSDSPDIAAMLLEKRADPRIVDDHERTVLHMASWGAWGGRRGGKFVNGRAAGASPRCLRLILTTEEGRLCMHSADRDGGTPIAIASATGALDVRDPPPELQDFLPLAAAAFRGHVDCMQMLLNARATPELRAKSTGRSAMDFAVIGQELPTAELLANQLLPGASTTAIFATALTWAVHTGVPGMIRLLAQRSPEALESQDFVHLVLMHGPSSRAEVTWPPFPANAEQQPAPPPPPRQSALRRGHLKPFSSVSITCCQALLEARAEVTESTLTSVLRRGLGRGPESEAVLLDALLRQYTRLRPQPSKLAWPLVAAAAADSPAAVSLLLASKADPAGADGFAFTAAADSEECLALLLKACEGVPRCPRTLDVTEDDKVSLLEVAAATGNAQCVALLLRGDNLAASAAAAAAQRAEHFDISRWLQSAEGVNSVVLGFSTSPCDRSARTARTSDDLSEGAQLLSWQSLLKPADAVIRSCSWIESLADARQALRSLKEDLDKSAILGVDLECYGDVVCTLQMATVKRTVVLDALKLHGDVAELVSSIFSDGSVIKLFHAPRNDMRWLWSNFGIQVVNMFDTDTVAMLVYERKLGVGRHRSLKELCKRFLQMDLEMLAYAARDAEVLLPLAKHLASMANDQRLLKESLQSCRRQQDISGKEGIRVELLGTEKEESSTT
ncbi:EXOSC10 [Symbiodinium sp. CCMP2592]|nr:EXOSC10 [Symbiodinium sp. CCMP2592]